LRNYDARCNAPKLSSVKIWFVDALRNVNCLIKFIFGAIATRAIMADLRAGMDGITGGPAPFAKADRSRFLQALDEALVKMR
jgi:hypothetical protein